jgi:hypothetical protein
MKNSDFCYGLSGAFAGAWLVFLIHSILFRLIFSKPIPFIGWIGFVWSLVCAVLFWILAFNYDNRGE